jgi:1-acyl-sn-glycerol-3-phosphate acyltransferase
VTIDEEVHLEDADEGSSGLVEDIGMLGIGSRVLPPDIDSELSDERPSQRPGLLLDDAAVEAKIREIEDRLDGLMAHQESLDSGGLDPDPGLPPVDDTASSEDILTSARELLTSDYYRRRWGRHALRTHVSGVDDFGLDPAFETRVAKILQFLFRFYFRASVGGLEHVPSAGRGLIVANHSGALPFDGLMLRQAIRLRHPAKRDLRWLSEDYTFYLPFIGVGMNRLGAVRACQENAQRLLAHDHLVAAFPEGTEGIKKLYADRYRLQRFGRGGFVRLAILTQSPMIPCAIVGGEETNPILYRFDNLSKLVGLEYLPITPTFPWLGPLGLLPAPTKWRIHFGPPISVAEYGPESAADHVLVSELAERVQTTIQRLIDDGLRARRGVFF